MAEFISRKERNAALIANTNQEIENLKNYNDMDSYVSSVLTTLNIVDSKYFSKIYDELKAEFDIGKFYLGKDKSKYIINPEVLINIKNQYDKIILNSINKVNLDNDKIIKSQLISDDDFYIDENRIIYENIRNIQLEQNQKNKNQEELNRDKKIALRNVTEKEFKAIREKIGTNPASQVFLKGRDSVYKNIREILKKSENYKVKTKWYVITATLLIVVMALAIVVPIFV
ncbi:hypothetical protein CXP39_02565 [Mesoplasma syrphidae]|uniref:Uncharacterized protein n=1 Tax=Mesoplasma syrphidae TaxID=225999 RepID=A0A2K9BZ74_9MOLU|nr:hypothetical protein [Mesoplasma syrphidae]AUF83668.1 hypothetical protein CXP39_02565 [Mesoplasma syrphidae]